MGRLQNRKGQDNVIRALPAVVERSPNVRYLILGDPHGENAGLPDMLKGLILELGLSENVSLISQISDAELPYFYANCDLFVMANCMDPRGDVEGF